MISRRQFMYLSALLSFFPAAKPAGAATEKQTNYPLTLSILKDAYKEERFSKLHYDGYCQRALGDNYPNMAYLFLALSCSERIHAENYKVLIQSLGSTPDPAGIDISIKGTKANLKTAAVKELEKINVYYPKILRQLSAESHDQAVMHCMYSWKSHQQHEKIITDIKNYSGIFFSHLSKKIEDMNPNYHVCEICGSTIDDPPQIPCEICNYPMSHYHRIHRPVLGED